MNEPVPTAGVRGAKSTRNCGGMTTQFPISRDANVGNKFLNLSGFSLC